MCLYLYDSVENRKILHEQEAERMLIHLLGHESAEVQASAAQALAVMAENLASRDSIREWGRWLLTFRQNFTLNTS